MPLKQPLKMIGERIVANLIFQPDMVVVDARGEIPGNSVGVKVNPERPGLGDLGLQLRVALDHLAALAGHALGMLLTPVLPD